MRNIRKFQRKEVEAEDAVEFINYLNLSYERAGMRVPVSFREGDEDYEWLLGDFRKERRLYKLGTIKRMNTEYFAEQLSSCMDTIPEELWKKARRYINKKKWVEKYPEKVGRSVRVTKDVYDYVHELFTLEQRKSMDDGLEVSDEFKTFSGFINGLILSSPLHKEKFADFLEDQS